MKTNMKKTHEQFLVDVFERHGDSISILSTYHNAKTKVIAKCAVDGHEWPVIPNNLLTKSGCPECARKLYGAYHKKDTKTFKKELKEVHPTLELLSEYAGSDSPITVRCTIDGNEWKTTPYVLIRSSGCSECWLVKSIPTKEEMQDSVNTHSKGYTALRTFRCDKRRKLLVRHETCGYEWQTDLHKAKRKISCPDCAKVTIQSWSDVTLEVIKIHPHIRLIGDYYGRHAKTNFLCMRHNHVFEKTPDSIVNSETNCPLCSEYGFRKDKPAVLYIYDLGDYVGFGISNNFERRHGNHKANFSKYGISHKLLFLYSGNGSDISYIESKLKKNLPISDSGIHGFKTESVRVSDAIKLYDAIERYVESGNIVSVINYSQKNRYLPTTSLTAL